MHSKKTRHFIENFARNALKESLGGDFNGCTWYGHESSEWVDDAGAVVKKSPLKTSLDGCLGSGSLWSKVEKKLFVKVVDLDIVVAVELSRVVNSPTQRKVVEAIEKSRQAAKDNFAATHDGLTGLLNRERFDEDLINFLSPHPASSLASASLAFKPEATYLLSLDIDHFKNVNDKHGHVYGDAVLAAFAWRVEDAVAKFVESLTSVPSYGVYRLGGEEFQIVVAGSVSIEDIGLLCKSLNLSISGEVLPSEQEWLSLSRRQAFRGFSLPHASERKVTVSIGVSWAAPSKSAADISLKLKRQSDIALYSAKSGGRDCVRLFPEILEKYGRVLEFHSETGVVAIDIGEDVGVQPGQEFFVFHPDFSGGVEFFAGEGRSRKRLGFYPRLKVGRIRVVDVQNEVSFCVIVDLSDRVSALVSGSTIEEIPLGSIAHLLSSGVIGSDSSTTSVDAVKNVFKNENNRKSWIVIDLEISGFDEFYSSKGSTASNVLLASVFDLIIGEFGGNGRAGYVDGGEIVAAVLLDPKDDLPNHLASLISKMRNLGDAAVELRIGYCLPADSKKIVEHIQDSRGWWEVSFELARSARLVASADRPIIKFSKDSVESLIAKSRLALKHDRAIADFEMFRDMGVVSAAIENQVGLCFAEMTRRDYISSERHLRNAVKLDPSNEFYLANLGLIQLISGSGSSSDSFMACLKLKGSVPESYESAALMSFYREGGRERLHEIARDYPIIVSSLRSTIGKQHYVSTADVSMILSTIVAP